MKPHIYSYKPTDLTDTALDVLAFENLTRRRFIIGAAGLALSACGAPSANAPTATPATRRIKHAFGETEVPLNPQRIATIDDVDYFYGLATLGKTPATVALGLSQPHIV